MTSESPYAGRTVLVTGATGFVGAVVARSLLSEGARVVGTMRDPARAASARLEGIDWHVVDLELPGQMAALVARVRPVITFHLAGYGVAKEERDPQRAERLNHLVLEELCGALARTPSPDGWSGLRLVNVGSALEYGRIEGALDEARVGAPDTIYGETKVRGTQCVARFRARGLAALTARLFTVFGSGERPGRLVPMLLEAVEGDAPIELSAGHQPRDFLDVDGVSEGLLRLGLVLSRSVLVDSYPFDAPAINLATSRLTSVRVFVETFADVFGIARDRLHFGKVPQLAEEMFHGAVPIERLRSALGWVPEATLRAMLERLRAWHRSPP